MKHNFISSLSVLALLWLMAGCATVPPASKEARDLAASFTPHPEYAGVYIFRPTDVTLHGLKLKDVSLDHISVGELGNESFLYLPVAPGKHLCWMWDADPGSPGIPPSFHKFEWKWIANKLVVEAGKNYFFVSRTSRLHPISEAKAKVYAANFALSSLCGPKWAAQVVVAQGSQPSFVYDNVLPGMPVMPFRTGVYSGPPTIRFWAPSGGIGVIQAGLLINMGRR